MIEQNDKLAAIQINQATDCCSDSAATDNCCSEQDLIVDNSSSCCGDNSVAKNNRLLVMLRPLWSAWSLIPVLLLMVMLFDPMQLQQIIDISIAALAGTLPYIIFAVLLLSYLKASGAENLVSTAFVGRENRMIIVAAFFGGLAPFCSCEVIPFIAGLLALGVPVSAVMAFWLSSPLIDPPSLLITAGALGWEFAVGKAIAALFLGLLGGFGVKYLLKSDSFQSPLKAHSVGGCSTNSCCSDEPYKEAAMWKFWQQKPRRVIFVEQSVENGLFLIKWLSLAYLLEALLITYVPASLIGGIVGGEGFLPIVIGALVGMPAYLNSYAAPPLVAGLMEQGMSTGSAMAFMVAGSISSIPAMTAVWSLVRKPVFFAYLGFGLGGSILFAVIYGFVTTL